eukprot:jgi/Mesvir1/20486/Mv12372-RA.1
MAGSVVSGSAAVALSAPVAVPSPISRSHTPQCRAAQYVPVKGQQTCLKATFLKGESLQASRKTARRAIRKSLIRSESSDGGDASPALPRDNLAPAQPDSAAGSLLRYLLKTNPHLFNDAMDSQLERLASERDNQAGPAVLKDVDPADVDKLKAGELKRDEVSRNLPALRRRIEQLKETDRLRTVVDILYSLVVSKFVAMDMNMLPSISEAAKMNPGEISRPDDELLLSVHTKEARSMILQHVDMLFAGVPMSQVNDPRAVAPLPISRANMIYAASLMFGYFLRRVDTRYSFEKRMLRGPMAQLGDGGASPSGEASVEVDPALGSKIADLKTYVSNFSPEILQSMAKPTLEGVQVVRKQLSGLFGSSGQLQIFLQEADARAAAEEARARGEGQPAQDDKVLVMSVPAVRNMVLEAVVFGTFLCDAEEQVGIRYPLTPT